ncbi:MAG: AAA domain-containing protein [Marinobacterium sp.]|nr:AAA domain-containing protein [Marinobacterium sp.]
MKVIEYSGLSDQVVQLKPVGSEAFDRSDWLEGEAVQLIAEGEYFYLQQGTQLVSVQPAGSLATLRQQLGRRYMLWVLLSVKAERCSLGCVSLTQAPLMMSLQVRVRTMLMDDLHSRKLIRVRSMDQAIAWLTEEFTFNPDPQQGMEAESAVFLSIYPHQASRQLELRGRTYSANLVETDGHWEVHRVSPRLSAAESALIQGTIGFVDASATSQMQTATHRRMLKETIGSYGSYVALWQQYSEVEWQRCLRVAQRLGTLRYSSCTAELRNSLEWCFEVKPEQGLAFTERWEALLAAHTGPGEPVLEVSAQIPDWLNTTELNASDDAEETRQAGKGDKPWLCDWLGYQDGKLRLRLQGKRNRKPSANTGVIHLSSHGERKVYQRRNEALQSIQSRTNPMQALPYLLESVAVPFDKARGIKAMSKSARARFKGEPTKAQKEALKVALNTPDLALIIGPPGTGKTQVISALQVRLAEIMEDKQIEHQMLVTSFQHDAVDNVAERSGVFGLPAVKVGGRRKTRDDQVDPVERWCQEKSAQLAIDLQHEKSQQPIFELTREFRRQLVLLRMGQPTEQRQQTIDEINRLLQLLEQEYQWHLLPDLRERWQQWQQGQTMSVTLLKHCFLLRCVRALRVTDVAFDDDGPQQCQRLLDTCLYESWSLDEAEQQVLQACAMPGQTAQLDALKQLRNQLLKRLQPDRRPLAVQQHMDDDSYSLLDALAAFIDQHFQQSASLGYLQILDEYQSALELSPDSIRDAVQTYSAVLAASCQQSAAEPMIGLKQVQYQAQIGFDTVIVDEAARANPLDLMIPMAMGERRIVLVGDHRQLPHLLEPDVEAELAEQYELETVQYEMLQQSLFERLVKSMQSLEKEQGQPCRVVMLDTQFRMHPRLGDFVSQQFYEASGLPAVKSELDASCYAHKIPGFENCIAAWNDVPGWSGDCSRDNGSRKRDAEATMVAEEVAALLRSSPDLSIGVITFYRAQVNAIMQALQQKSISQLTETGELEIAPAYQMFTDNDGKRREKLRVGSVDAFQGKEFDVVLLSLVRTAPKQKTLEGDEALNRAYGFLRLDNRLNVAMSRQQRLLIVVGDKALAQHGATVEAVPSLPAFLELCKESSYGRIY